ncbi:hypothetical protein K2173_012035 [Erythroxylum novogranatense]|uniref:Uncharacterized protein n=1 Tax=Erythroxylum novogranatense TaxID=1862640 RepID=A0AAV8TGE0_9ROSI|nr:hypothetical protein K2173_012035 [Erythroxylum novogranatense]
MGWNSTLISEVKCGKFIQTTLLFPYYEKRATDGGLLTSWLLVLLQMEIIKGHPMVKLLPLHESVRPQPGPEVVPESRLQDIHDHGVIPVSRYRDEKIVSGAIELIEQLQKLLIRHKTLLADEREETGERLFPSLVRKTDRLQKGKACARPENEGHSEEHLPFGLVGPSRLNHLLIWPVPFESGPGSSGHMPGSNLSYLRRNMWETRSTGPSDSNVFLVEDLLENAS